MKPITLYYQPIKNWITQIAHGVVIIWCYYEGLQKYLAFESYRFWMQHAPLVKNYTPLPAYLVPALLLTSAAMLLFSKTKLFVLDAIIAFQIVFVAWVAYIFYATPYLFWPYHAVWPHPIWFQKFMEALVIAWTALIARVLDKRKINHSLFRNKTATCMNTGEIAETH